MFYYQTNKSEFLLVQSEEKSGEKEQKLTFDAV